MDAGSRFFRSCNVVLLLAQNFDQHGSSRKGYMSGWLETERVSRRSKMLKEAFESRGNIEGASEYTDICSVTSSHARNVEVASSDT